MGSWKLRVFGAAFAGISSADAAGAMETGVGADRGASAESDASVFSGDCVSVGGLFTRSADPAKPTPRIKLPIHHCLIKQTPRPDLQSDEYESLIFSCVDWR